MRPLAAGSVPPLVGLGGLAMTTKTLRLSERSHEKIRSGAHWNMIRSELLSSGLVVAAAGAIPIARPLRVVLRTR